MHLCNIWYKEPTARFPATPDNQYYQFLGILSGWFLYITVFSHHHLFWCRNATTQNHLLKSATCLSYFHAWHLLMPPSTLRIKVRPIIMSYKASHGQASVGLAKPIFSICSPATGTKLTQLPLPPSFSYCSSVWNAILLLLSLTHLPNLRLYFLKPSLAPRPNKADNTIFSFIVLIRVVISIYGNYIGFKFL